MSEPVDGEIIFTNESDPNQERGFEPTDTLSRINREIQILQKRREHLLNP